MFRRLCLFVSFAGLLLHCGRAGRLYADDPASAPDAASMARVRAYEQARIELIQQLHPTVVCLFNSGNRAGGGSGVIIDPEGYGLTNFHVIAGMLESRAGDAGFSDGSLQQIDVLGLDPTGDMAMFQARGAAPFAFATFGDSDNLTVGDYALAMGNPFLLAEDFTPTITLGIISGLNRYQAGAGEQGRALRYTDCIQVDTSINPGNSGGPLFDLSGRLIGINGRVSIEERGRVNVGVGYAISINQIKRFIPMWRAGLTTRHATAGFTVFDRARSVIVDQILPDSAAYRAGVRLGDEIVEFAGRRITSSNQFGSYLGVFPAHWPVDIVCLRKGKQISHHFRLEDLPLPKMNADGPAAGADPLRQTDVTRAANRRAVQRAIDRLIASLGGAETLSRVAILEWKGERHLAAKPQDAPEMLNLEEKRDEMVPFQAGLTPVVAERAIRWALMNADTPLAKHMRVVGADEIDRRIAVVIRAKLEDGAAFHACFDDDSGELLRIEFDDSFSGKKVRYEYADYRRVGAMRLPHRRSLFLDEVVHAIETFDSVRARG